MATCNCGSDSKTFIYTCSGAANTGLLADRVARQLAISGQGSLTCLAAVGAGLENFIKSAGCAARNIVIDGCPVACGKLILEKAGATYDHYVMTDFGVEKGKTAITDEVVQTVFEKTAAAVAK